MASRPPGHSPTCEGRTAMEGRTGQKRQTVAQFWESCQAHGVTLRVSQERHPVPAGVGQWLVAGWAVDGGWSQKEDC